MKKLLLLLLVLIFIKVEAQNKVFLDYDFKSTDEKSAQYYGIATPENGKYRNALYYLSGQLFVELIGEKPHDYLSNNDGKTLSYYENGKLAVDAFYENGLPVGKYKSYYEDGRVEYDLNLVDGHKNGKYYRYKRKNPNDTSDYYYLQADYLTEYKDDKIMREIIYDGDINGIRIEVEMLPDYYKKERYYDQKGKFIAENTFETGLPQTGKFVEYYYEPMAVQSIYDLDENTGNTEVIHYFRNGQIRTEIKQKDSKKTETNYAKDGKKFAELSYEVTDHLPKNMHGKEVNYHPDFETVASIIDYINGRTRSRTTFYENGNIREEMKTNDQGVLREIVQYDEKRNQKEKLIYKDGEPWNGKLTELESDVTYENGKLISETRYTALDRNDYISIQNRVKYLESKLVGDYYETEIFNSKGEKELSYKKYPSESGLFTADITAYENGKPKYQAKVQTASLVSGTLRMFYYEGTQIWTVDGDWIVKKYYEGNKLVKEEKINKPVVHLEIKRKKDCSFD